MRLTKETFIDTFSTPMHHHMYAFSSLPYFFPSISPPSPSRAFFSLTTLAATSPSFLNISPRSNTYHPSSSSTPSSYCIIHDRISVLAHPAKYTSFPSSNNPSSTTTHGVASVKNNPAATRMQINSIEDIPLIPFPHSLETIPDRWNVPGVYAVYSPDGELMYVSGSRNIRTHIVNHLIIFEECKFDRENDSKYDDGKERISKESPLGALRMISWENYNQEEIDTFVKNWCTTLMMMKLPLPEGNIKESGAAGRKWRKKSLWFDREYSQNVVFDPFNPDEEKNKDAMQNEDDGEGQRKQVDEDDAWLLAVDEQDEQGNQATTVIAEEKMTLTPSSSSSVTSENLQQLWVNKQISKILKSHRVVLFINGTRKNPNDEPSRKLIEIIEQMQALFKEKLDLETQNNSSTQIDPRLVDESSQFGLEFSCVNVFDTQNNPGLQLGLTQYSQSSAVPQLYISGNFAGDHRVISDLFQKNHLESMLEDPTKVIKDLIVHNKVVVFIKGTRHEPKCKFSQRLISVLQQNNIDYVDRDVLNNKANPGLLDALKLYSEWPIIPQVYINGLLFGGTETFCDAIQNEGVEAVMQENLK